MNEFLLIFRRDSSEDSQRISPEQMQAAIKPWQDWLADLAAQNKLVQTPVRWSAEGRVVHQDHIMNGPYAEVKESIGGLIFVKADDFTDAIAIAKGCPILQNPWNGNVEIRMAVSGNSE